MDTNAYIQSGILELYLLNQLSVAEMEEVNTMRATHTVIDAEIIAIENTFALMAFANQKIPPAALKEKILAPINAIEPQSTLASVNKYNTTKLSNYWTYAASTIAIIGVVTSIYLYKKHTLEQQQYALLILQNKALQQQADSTLTNNTLLQQKNELALQELIIIKNSSCKKIILTSTDTTQPLLPASIYWNTTSNDVYLSWNNTSALPANKQYQLWAIIDGKPVDAGVFDVSTALQKMKPIANQVAAFAVTIEPMGGNTTPTLTAMVVMGKV